MRPAAWPEPDRAVFAAPVGALRGPVPTQFGFYVFQVVRIVPPMHQTLSQVAASIAQAITAERQSAALTAWVQTFEAKWTNLTYCRRGFVVRDCGHVLV